MPTYLISVLIMCQVKRLKKLFEQVIMKITHTKL